ncbi:MAG: DUF454 domain-containing protein [Spirochaetia bacterium]|nr:DUF454 domain-containing protein [Spirochaetia bacterium]
MKKEQREKKTIKYLILSSIAFTSLFLGLIGIFLPVLPTTPFVILAAGLFSVSDPSRAKKLEQSKIFGSYLRHWRTRQGIPLKTKMRAIIFLWIGLLISMWLVKQTLVSIILATIGLIVTVHLILIKTDKEAQSEVLKATSTHP